MSFFEYTSSLLSLSKLICKYYIILRFINKIPNRCVTRGKRFGATQGGRGRNVEDQEEEETKVLRRTIRPI